MKDAVGTDVDDREQEQPTDFGIPAIQDSGTETDRSQHKAAAQQHSQAPRLQVERYRDRLRNDRSERLGNERVEWQPRTGDRQADENIPELFSRQSRRQQRLEAPFGEH